MKIIFGFDELGKTSLVKGAIYESGGKGNPFSDDPLAKLFKLEGFKRGIGNQSGFRKSNQERNGVRTADTAFVVIKDSQAQSEWPNEYLKDKGIFVYYGDNRDPEKHYLDTKQKGNAFLEKVFNASYGSVEQRQSIPPIFVFRSIHQGSSVEFIGLAVPGVKGKSIDESLILQSFEKDGATFMNYVAFFSILKTEEINRFWLRDLKDADNSNFTNAPPEWNQFILNGLDAVESSENHFPSSVSNTTLEHSGKYEVYVRKTQGKFRESLLRKEKKCRMCGLDIEELLVASHIKAWNASNDEEKTNINNGFLLCCGHDALFDKGYISFNEDGSILISSDINERYYDILNINSNMVIPLGTDSLCYLEWHRENIFKK